MPGIKADQQSKWCNQTHDKLVTLKFLMMQKTTLPKVFVIGHHKIATRSIHQLFKVDGYKSIHWKGGRIAETMLKNMRMSQPLLKGIESASVYSDMEYLHDDGEFFYGHRLFPILDLQYPGSIFIFNTRNLDSWIKSQLAHKSRKSGLYVRRIRKGLKTIYPGRKIKNRDVIKMWRRTWQQHEDEVNRYFSGKSNLLRVNIESVESKKQLISSLRTFGYQLTSDDLPYVGATPKKRKISSRHGKSAD